MKIHDDKAETTVYRKPNVMSIHWTSRVPRCYDKMNTINGDLNRSFQISMNFEQEKERIREKYRLAAFLTDFFLTMSFAISLN